MKNLPRIFMSLMAVFVFSLLAACSAPKAVTLGDEEKEQVLAFSEPYVDNLLTGLNANDYAVFSRDFTPEMLKGIDEKGFADLQTKVMPKLGAYQSRTVTSVESVGDYYRLIYRAGFAEDANVRLTITFTKAEPHRVAGLFFNSDKLK